MSSVVEQWLTLGQAAQAVGCPEWWLRRAYRLGRLPEPPRVGLLRALAAADVEAARQLWTRHQAARGERA